MLKIKFKHAKTNKNTGGKNYLVVSKRLKYQHLRSNCLPTFVSGTMTYRSRL